MGFNLENYETVKDRITRFYADHANGRILTELVNNPDTLSEYAAFKAYAYLDDVLKATGYAMEQKGQGVNRDAWVENAETSAIGRALANMDYCGTMRPSREEMSKVNQEQSIEDILDKAVADGILTPDKADETINAYNAKKPADKPLFLQAVKDKIKKTAYENLSRGQ
jgi:hypothetical protein